MNRRIDPDALQDALDGLYEAIDGLQERLATLEKVVRAMVRAFHDQADFPHPNVKAWLDEEGDE